MAHDVVVFAMGVLGRSMGGDKPDAQPPNTIKKEMTSTETVKPTENGS